MFLVELGRLVGVVIIIPQPARSSSDLWGTRAKLHVNDLAVQGHSAVFFQNVTILFACMCQIFIYELVLLYKHCKYAQWANILTIFTVLHL